MWEVLIYLYFILLPHEKVRSSFQFLEGISFQARLSDEAAVAGGSSVPTHASSLQRLESQTNYTTARTTVAHIGVRLAAGMNCKCSFNHCIINSEPWFCFANKQQWGNWNSWTSESMVHWDQQRRPHALEKRLWIACSLGIWFIFIKKIHILIDVSFFFKKQRLKQSGHQKD